VIPSPVGPGHGTTISNGVVELLAQEPGRQLVDLHLAKWNISLSIEDGRVIRSMDSLVITLR